MTTKTVTKTLGRRSRQETRSVRRIAQKLARAHNQDLGYPEPVSQQVEESVALLAMELPVEGRTLCWEALDVPGLFEELGLGDLAAEERLAQHLMGFYYWLCIQEMASPDAVAEIIHALYEQFPDCLSLSLIHDDCMIGLFGGIDAVLAASASADEPAVMSCEPAMMN